MPSCAHPWLLLLIPVWVALLMMRRRAALAQASPAADFELWRRAAAKLGAPPSARRRSWRDLLRALPAALLTAAAADPGVDAPEREVTLLVDRSPSMGALVDGRTRIERGLDAARALAGAAPLRCVWIPSPATTERAESASGADADTAALLREARAFASAGATCLVITDGVEALEPPAGAGLVRVVDDGRNAGLAAVGRRTGAGLLIRTAGDSGCGSRRLRVLDAAGSVRFDTDLPDAADGRVVVPESALPESTAPLRVELAPRDACPADDVVETAAAPRAPRIVVAPSAPEAFARAASAVPDAEMLRAARPDGADVFVSPGAPADAGDAFMVLTPPCDAFGFASGAAFEKSGVVRGVGAWAGAGGGAAGAATLTAAAAMPPDAEVLLTLDGAPVVARRGRVAAYFIDLAASAWPSDASFPLTFDRLLHEAGVRRGDVARARRCGATAEFVAPAGAATTLRWRAASGGAWVRTVAADDEGRVRVVLDDPGVGELEGVVGGPISLAAATLDDRASRVACTAPAEVRAPIGGMARRARRSWAAWLGAAGVLAAILLVGAGFAGSRRRAAWVRFDGALA